MTSALLEPRTAAAAGSDGSWRAAVADRLWRPLPTDRLWSWLLTLAITGFGAVLRWPGLDRPHAFSFDETYYAKDAFSLLEFGYEREFVDKANEQILASNGDPSALQGVFAAGPEYVVHPPAGKWVIAVGEHFFGITPFGWRFMVALLGTLAIVVTIRAGRRLTRSTLIGAAAGLFVAIDGQAIVHSRTALLDPILMFWVLVAFAALLLDRDRTRRRLAERVLAQPDDASAVEAARGGLAGWFGWRPWLWVAGVGTGPGLRDEVVGAVLPARVRAAGSAVGHRRPAHPRGPPRVVRRRWYAASRWQCWRSRRGRRRVPRLLDRAGCSPTAATSATGPREPGDRARRVRARRAAVAVALPRRGVRLPPSAHHGRTATRATRGAGRCRPDRPRTTSRARRSASRAARSTSAPARCWRSATR